MKIKNFKSICFKVFLVALSAFICGVFLINFVLSDFYGKIDISVDSAIVAFIGLFFTGIAFYIQKRQS